MFLQENMKVRLDLKSTTLLLFAFARVFLLNISALIEAALTRLTFTFISSLMKDAMGTCVLFEEGPAKGDA